jgi:cytoskeletal protein RodZ
VPRNEDGEFELVLANRQLLSVFFIVVILLGVFFTMGYIVGRSSAPVATADSTRARQGETKPLVVDSAAPPPAIETPAEQPAEPAPEPAAAKAPVSTAPQQSGDVAGVEAKAKPERSSKADTGPEPAKPAPRGADKDEPAPGERYLQLVATAKAEADVMVDVLRRKGFHAIQSPVPGKEGWFRVLVGPVPDGALNKTKADLQAAGFPGDKAIPKTF